MPYTPGASAASGPYSAGGTQTYQQANNAETQYTEAVLSHDPNEFSAGWVLLGGVCTKDGTTPNQLDVTAGAAYLLQASDNTFRRRSITASTPGQFLTTVINTTYYLDLNPDSTWSWGTAHSATSGHLTIATVTTDGAGNISTVTDTRQVNTTMYNAAVGTISIPGQVQVGAGNQAAAPVEIIIVGPNSGALPAAGVRGRIAFVLPFTLP